MIALKPRLGVGLAAALLGFSMAASAQVKVGVINSLSGPFSAFGERYQTGMEVALEEINAAGGINGEPLELVVHDDRSEAQSALSSVESMKGDGIPLLIGSYASSITGPMARLATRQEIPLIVLGSADDSITKPGSPWSFEQSTHQPLSLIPTLTILITYATVSLIHH